MSKDKFESFLKSTLENRQVDVPNMNAVWQELEQKLDAQSASASKSNFFKKAIVFSSIAAALIASIFLINQNENKVKPITPIILDTESSVAQNIEEIVVEPSPEITNTNESVQPEQKVSQNQEINLISVEKTLIKKQTPQIIVSKNKACVAEILDFKVENPKKKHNYEWHFGDGLISSQLQPSHRFNQAGLYQITLNEIDKKTGNTLSSLPFTIEIQPKPNSFFEYSCTDIDLHNPALCFNAIEEKATLYHWDFGDGKQSDEKSPKHLYNQKGHYGVKLLVANEFGCKDSSKQQVRVIRGYNLMALPTFSPDKEKSWLPLALLSGNKKFYLKILNENGEIVYETQEASKAWNGQNKKGETAIVGDNFLWIASVWNNETEVSEFGGNINIIE